MHRFEDVKEGPIPREIMEFMRSEYGCEISYQHAWDAREYAVSVARGIPEKGYGKIPKYLHMLKQANPGTHTHFETDSDNRFKYLFIAFGQSIRGFYRAMRKVIVVDALDGDSSLYPIAFGVVDSENDRSWEWFFRQLLVVIADGQGVAFCTKGLVGLIAKASKEYRVSEFERRFNDIRNISPLVAKYLMEAGVEKWARCKFSGFRYDIRTTNPAESMNSVLLAPREFPVIPLLDSIREMLTKWRIEKGKSLRVHPVSLNRFLVRGDKFDCVVDLELRTCTCGKYTLLKIPCRHAIKAGFSVNKEPHTLTDARYTTAVWRIAYEESINPIAVPEDAWVVPLDIENSKVLAPETRRAAGRRRKRRYETVEDDTREGHVTCLSRHLVDGSSDLVASMGGALGAGAPILLVNAATEVSKPSIFP
ncbi:uncharacterized protein LOC112087744 [Eutrema salsugineum]|uniref:uncharacterized protein LOC112087744 n=1 Tax=Eutrema salsugineum TaxID=72664 RepID=UPI000CED2837|nr:uncharacterized protein LOC112087744 [Eutrema salsugineum]